MTFQTEGSRVGRPGRRTRRRAASRTTRQLRLTVPDGFVLDRVVMSHGWFDLPPFRWDAERQRLTRTLRLPEAGPAVIHVSLDGAAPAAGTRLRLQIKGSRPAGAADLREAARLMSRVLRLDEDLGLFHALAERVARPDLRWARGAGAGRLMRSPTVFEDLVKMIATTNCSWALTRVMVGALVRNLGEATPEGGHLFPEPEAMAGASPAFYRDEARAGYRGVAFRSLARDVAAGRLDPESWLDPESPTEAIRDSILSVRGAGPYVADNMLKLLGRYDGLGIDSWCRRKFSSMHAGGRKVKDDRIESFYAPFGAWRGLALWCDITRDWFEEGSPREKFSQAGY